MKNKIDVQKIEWRNMFSYGNKWSEFTPNGISFITGNNLNTGRRNFTGKTNLLKIFLFSLYGKIPDLTKARIINWKNRKNAECKVTFKKGESVYIIHRGIKPDILKVYENEKELPEPSNRTDFQKQIESEILEMDFDTFLRIVFADTNNTSSILNMKKPDKRKFLEQMFDLEYHTKLNDKANKAIAKLQTKIGEIEIKISFLNNQKQDLNNQIKKWSQEKNNLPDSNTTLKMKQTDYSILLEDYNEALKTLKDLLIEKERLTEYKNKKENTKTKILYKKKELQLKYCQVTETPDSIDDLETLLKSLNDKHKEIPFPDIGDDDFNTEIINCKNEISTIKSEIKFLTKKIDEINSDIKSKESMAICPTCFQKVDLKTVEKHYLDSLNSLTDDKYKLEIELVSKGNLIEGLIEKNQQQQQNTGTKEFNSKLIDGIAKLQDKITAKQKEITELKKSKKYDKICCKLHTVYGIINDTNIQDEIDNVIQQIDNYNNIIKKYDALEKEIESLKIKIESEQKQKDQFDKLIQENKDKLKQIEIDQKKYEKETTQSKNISDYFLVIKNACGDNEAKQYTISNKLPFLNKRVNEYLNSCDVNFYLWLDSWLEAEIKGPGIKDCVYANLSGAERVSIDRSLQFTFNDIVKLNSPTYFNLLILDEILDNSVDNEGLKNLVEIIKTKKEKDNLNVLIVSHRDGVSEFPDFVDNMYCVEFDNGYSQLKRIN